MRAPLRSGSRGPTETTSAAGRWESEWAAAEATDRLEAAAELRHTTRARILVVGPLAALGALLAAIFPLTPGFSPTETGAATIAAAVAAATSLAWVPLADRFARRLPAAGAGDLLVYLAALASAAAGAIHLAVAKRPARSGARQPSPAGPDGCPHGFRLVLTTLSLLSVIGVGASVLTPTE